GAGLGSAGTASLGAGLGSAGTAAFGAAGLGPACAAGLGAARPASPGGPGRPAIGPADPASPVAAPVRPAPAGRAGSHAEPTRPDRESLRAGSSAVHRGALDDRRPPWERAGAGAPAPSARSGPIGGCSVPTRPAGFARSLRDPRGRRPPDPRCATD